MPCQWEMFGFTTSMDISVEFFYCPCCPFNLLTTSQVPIRITAEREMS